MPLSKAPEVPPQEDADATPKATTNVKAEARARDERADTSSDPLLDVSRRYHETDSLIVAAAKRLEDLRRKTKALEEELDRLRQSKADIKAQMKQTVGE